MTFHIRLNCAVLLLVFFCCMVNQSLGQGLTTPGQALASMGIGLDASSLINALRDSRGTVRSLAAATLGDEHISAAIPEMQCALTSEHDALVAYRMTLALAQLDAPGSSEQLAKYCTGQDTSVTTYMVTANFLASKGDYTCVQGSAKYINSSDDSTRQAVLLYLSQAEPARKVAPASVGRALLVAARDPDPYLRDLAGKAILKIGDPDTRAAYAKLLQRPQ